MKNLTSKQITLFCTIFVLHIYTTVALECYACDNQDSNKDKCIKTTKQCEEHQDICITYVSWGLPPYWVPYGDRMHYVSKDCDTRVACESKKSVMQPQCKRDWYDDWSCIECCSGDLCNYYVTLSSSALTSSVMLLLTTCSISLGLFFYQSMI